MEQILIKLCKSLIYTCKSYLLINITNLIRSAMDIERDTRNKFLKASDGDTPVTKLWKYRALIINYPQEAMPLKQKMLDLALKNKLLGQYEMIHRLMGVAQNQIPRQGQYGRLKQQLVPAINSVKIQGQDYESGKVDEEVKTYFKLGGMLADIGDHKDSQKFYSRIIRRQTDQETIKDHELFPLWGKELFYMVDDSHGNSFSKDSRDYSDLEVFAMREIPDKKKMNATLAFLIDVYRLTRKGRGKGKQKVFENLKSEHFNTLNIINNGILSLLDLGFLYSIVALAHSDRETLKKDIKWSSKIQISYVQSDYRKLFNEIQKFYDNIGRFNPTVRFVYDDCHRRITKRILNEVLLAYQSIPFGKIQHLTGLNQAKVESFLRENPQLPFLIDPITQGVVYYEKSVLLYREALAYYNLIKEKYDEKARSLIHESKEEIDDSEFELRTIKRTSHGRMRPDRRFM